MSSLPNPTSRGTLKDENKLLTLYLCASVANLIGPRDTEAQRNHFLEVSNIKVYIPCMEYNPLLERHPGF